MKQLAVVVIGALVVACGKADPREQPSAAPSEVSVASDSLPSALPVLPSASVIVPSPPSPQYEATELPEPELMAKTLATQRSAMVRRMRTLHGLDDAQIARVEAVLGASKHIGQGNPEVVRHPMSRSECLARRQEVKDEKKPACGAPFMVPLFDPASQKEEQADTCIDRYEFPGLPCDYPVTWVSTDEAQQLCQAVGKRLCDAHEWEGACAGALKSPDSEYAFGLGRAAMRQRHNAKREIRWAYGSEKDHGKCATRSAKSKSCAASGWGKCGSNTYPAGAFPECRSPFGVYDLHGNVAEHMALPLLEKDLGKKGGSGKPEMKGSWFIFSRHEAHADDCRWRAPSWHDDEGDNHSNYHLGFRCCKDLTSQ